MAQIRQEALGASWSIKAWLKAHKISAKRASEDLGVSDTIIHVWDKNRRSPLAAWKSCQMLYRTTDSLGPLPKLLRPAQAYKVTEPMWNQAMLFDRQFQGTRFYVEPAGEPYTVEAPSTDAMERFEGSTGGNAPVQVQAPPDVLSALAGLLGGRTGPQPEPADAGVAEVLLTLLVQMKQQRDGLLVRVEQLEGLGDAAELRAQVVALRREVEQYRAMAEAATASRPASAESFERAAGLLRRRAPDLMQELANLPQMA